MSILFYAERSKIFFQVLWTASFQLGLTGARAQNPSIVFKVTRHELELVPILPQQMAETSVLASHRKIKIVPHRQMDALVRKSSSIRRSISFHRDDHINTTLKIPQLMSNIADN